MPVRAADFEIEEEVILGGTGGESTALYEKESEETLFQGTVEVSENEIADQDMQASLDKAANYLKTHVTNPVVNTLGGEWSVLAMARYGNLPEETKKIIWQICIGHWRKTKVFWTNENIQNIRE